MNAKKILAATGLLPLVLIAQSFADKPMVRLDDIKSDRIEAVGFELKKGGDFTIKAVGLRGRSSDYFVAYAWLLDSDTREPVWVMKKRNTKRHGRGGLARSDETISLEPGRYELYYYAAGRWSGRIIINGRNIFEFLGDIFDGDWDRDIDEYIDDFYVEIFPEKDNFKDFELFDPDGEIPNALLQLNRVGDSEYLQKGFFLDKKTSIRVYALSEYPSGNKSPVDYAWIINADTREKVWEMDRWNSDHAGGGRKNKVADEDVEFEKGKYILYYVTDDSHSYDHYNVMPPYDPYNWGVALLPTKKTDKKAFHLFEPEGRGEALIELTRIGDDEFVSQAFQLKSDQSIHIYSIGEYCKSIREFCDYGWIENATTGRAIWEMTYRNTEHAGGGNKNRMFDGVVNFPKGYYIVYYISDDSHSYEGWNDSPPYEPKAWGLALYPGKDFNKSKFELLDESELKRGADILVKMTGLRDNQRRTGKFTLKEQSKIRIYAIGEGDRDEMYDYGWITSDKTGRAVWEMTWRNTEPAGGARKNRLYDDTIILEPGKYIVNFVTDGSHSFNNWNASKPRDPSSWGITVSID